MFQQELPFGLNQSKFLLPALMEALKPFGPVPELAAIGVGMGPGSYTGIRIGAAIAQALAYSWKVPLIGVPCLENFIPSEHSIPFAAVLDARIGGIYFQRGKRSHHEVHFEREAQVSPLEEAGTLLEGIEHLVSPSVKSLQDKFTKLYPNKKWAWEERAPSVRMLLQNIERKHSKGEIGGAAPAFGSSLSSTNRSRAGKTQPKRKMTTSPQQFPLKNGRMAGCGVPSGSFCSSSVALATNSSQTEPADTPRSVLFRFLARITVFPSFC